MMDTALHFSSRTDLWATPQDLFERLDECWHFTLDVCAIAENAKCENYFSPDDDGLVQQWTGTCWMNPPYGRGGPVFRNRMAAWLRWILGSITPPISPGLPA